MVITSERGKTTPLKTGLAAAISGSITRGVSQPLDVIKVLLQLQVESASDQKAKYRSVQHVVKTVLKEEGVYGLWKGHVSAQLLSIVYGINQFVVFDITRSYLITHNYISLQNSFNDFFCGTVAGSVATVVSFPFDVIRTRVISQANVKVYTSTVQAITTLYTTEGFRGMFRGLSPCLIQAAPHAGAQFLFFNLFSRIHLKVSSRDVVKESAASKFVSNVSVGFIAGLCAKTTVYPFDLCRKRLQVQCFQHVREPTFGEPFVCNGLIDCVRKIYQKESILGFYKGLNASLLKAAVVSSMYFSLYVYFKDLLTGDA